MRDEDPGQDGEPAEQRRRAHGQAALAGLVDGADGRANRAVTGVSPAATAAATMKPSTASSTSMGCGASQERPTGPRAPGRVVPAPRPWRATALAGGLPAGTLPPVADVVQDVPLGPRDLAAPPRRELHIVPVAGLPIVGVVLVALVVAIATDRLWALEFFHVAFGGLWTGVDLFLGFVSARSSAACRSPPGSSSPPGSCRRWCC